ncbi:MAG: 4Fe-4S dicluster domain-containing protein [Promethearchaeota archaeon]|jgi:heterodisulfide reductase subunit C
MASKAKQFLLLMIYFLSPIFVSTIYLIENPLYDLVPLVTRLLGIFSFIWMCFNILMMAKISLIENNSSLEWILKFHTTMAIISLSFGFAHALSLVLMGGNYDYSQLITGFIGSIVIISLMVLANIFMSNRLIRNELILNLRVSAYQKKFKYNVNKILHNLTIAGVFIIFMHTLISYPSRNSLLMRSGYFIFFDITFIGWGYHKLVRRLRLDTDPYLHRKASWDLLADITTWVYQGTDSNWAIQLIKQTPSLYPCLQCGTCTSKCPVSNYTTGEYNARQLIQLILKGFKDKVIIEKDPNVWQCTQCYTCAENCPQHVELPDIIIFLRNKLAERREAPDGFLSEAKAVYNYGMSIPIQNAVIRRRKTLGLPPNPEYDVQEIQDILDMTGLNDIITEQTLVVKEETDTKHHIDEKTEVKSFIEGSQ